MLHVARILPLFAFAAFPLRAASLDFVRNVQPVLSEKCYHCHGPDEAARKAKLRLDVRDEALKEREGVRAIVPGKLEESDLWVRINSKDSGRGDAAAERASHAHACGDRYLSAGGSQRGAPYAKHWAFCETAARLRPPSTNDPANRNPIDAFIGAELQKHELTFSPEADPHTLIRRLSLDLVGLPPTPEQVSNFTKDWATLPDGRAGGENR
jgi:hypothetical protein